MTASRQIHAVDQSLVAEVIASSFPSLSFPPPLEARFEAETGAARSRQLLIRGIAGIVFAILYLAVDMQLTPDVFEAALWVRLAFVTPLSLLVAALLLRNPPPGMRETAAGGICVIAVVATIGLMLQSRSPLHDAHHYSAVLVILFATMVQRLRFRHAVVTCLAIYSAYAFGLTSLEGYPVERMITNNLIFGAIVVLALIASYSLEHELRLAYLLGLRERLRNRDLEVLSRHDALTGLDNRRSLEETLVRLGKSGGDGGIDLAIILADIDHFKSYNDSLGHLSGDVCLKRVAGIMQAELRTDGDMAFRFGGEEFLLLLPEADLSIAVGVAERIRRGIEDAAIPHPARVPLGLVTTSFGVAAAQLGGAHTADELIASADAALYAAKHNGRNQVWPRFAPSQPGTVIDLADRKSQIK